METPKITNQLAPPGLIASLSAGFNVVAGNIYLIFLPILLDLALWMGPRLRVYPLFGPMIDPSILPPELGAEPAILEALRAFWERFDLFSVVRTVPIGVFSLMSGEAALQSPLGLRAVIDVNSGAGLLLWLAALSVAGWILGSVFYALVARAALPGNFKMAHALAHAMLLSLVLALAGLMLGVPVMLFLVVWALVSPATLSFGYLLGILVAMWFAVPLFFAPHAIFTAGQNAFLSLWSSFRMARYAYSLGALFALSAFIISAGLDMLWRVPPRDTWLALVGIAGHGVVATAMLAASFIYYRDLHIWIQKRQASDALRG